ncbi:RNA-directed DNA polymerase, eukaryota [Tanacetum coccineum]
MLFGVSSFTRSVYFVIIEVLWLKSGIDLMIVVVYAPQEAKEKRMLWDYLAHVSNQWVGKLVMMGDFNEVRYKSDRYGSNFNAHDAEIFNSFIYNAGLDEVPLGGIKYDYGPIPFRFYRYWLEVMVGFDKLVRILGTWHKTSTTSTLISIKEEGVRRSGDEDLNGNLEEMKNVKFFHGLLNKKRNQFNIRGIMVNGMWVDDPVQMESEFFEHFQGRISKEEVKRVVWDCGVDKSPGPNGFSFSFYRHFWPVIKKDVFEAVDYFFMYGEIPNGCNSNFIALIPKILDANMVKDFRPISLIGSLYKIIAKILANRLVGVLGDLVNEVQSAFVAGQTNPRRSIYLDEDSFTYLGTKVRGICQGSKLESRSVGQGVIRLSRMEDEDSLSIGGRITLLKAIYGEDGNLNKDVSGGVRTCWTSIVHEVRVLQGRGINVADYIRLKLGNRENTRFWVDNWYEGGVIKELFPRMFALELNKNATVSSKLNASSLDNSFRRKARSGIEEMQLNSLAEISRMTTLVPCEDRYVWTLESDGVFSVASIRKEIDGNRFQDVSLPTRWVKSVPIKVNIIAWKVKSNALPTRFNISRRGMDIDSNCLVHLYTGVESTNHIFFQCVVVRQIMHKISSWWNIDYSDVNSYEEWRVWLVSIRIQSNLKGVLEGVYYGLWWYMWNFRNKLLFDKKIPENALIFDNLVSSSFYWCKFRCKASFKWDDWLKNPYIVLV